MVDVIIFIFRQILSAKRKKEIDQLFHLNYHRTKQNKQKKIKTMAFVVRLFES